jgi:tetratricopeptide (TPR) repeat protein
MDPAKLLESLMARTTLADRVTERALTDLGYLIDLSLDLEREDGLRHAINLGDELTAQQLAPTEEVLLNYFLGNAWDGIRALDRGKEDNGGWEWHQNELERQIVHFRRALQGAGYAGIETVRQCQILTNLGNAMSVAGRFIEAVEYFDRALERDSSFAMAQGNRGLVLARYAQALYDPGHAMALYRKSLDDLNAALRSELHPTARDGFAARAEWIAEVIRMNPRWKAADLDRFSLGDTDAETQYRRWCLENRLFVNPLNDVGPHTIAAHDVLTTPSIEAKLDEGPTHPGFFNQMKQEFVSARYGYYEAVTASAPHFSDRHVLLYNTLDYPAYSLAVERMKSAFRTAYSILDKLAYFLNDYLELGVPEVRVTFRTVWYQAQERKRGIREELSRRPNWPLRGLFWLSKDIYELSPGFRDTLEPDAQELATIRNHLEHKYLKLHDVVVPRDHMPDSLTDRLAFSVGRGNFAAKTLRLLKTARAALIYLSLALHAEERAKEAAHGDSPILPMPLGRIEDEWKV